MLTLIHWKPVDENIPPGEYLFAVYDEFEQRGVASGVVWSNGTIILDCADHVRAKFYATVKTPRVK